MSHAAATYRRVPYNAPPNYKGTANPKAHRRHSRRSSTRPDKRAHARRRATHPAQSQAAQPIQERPGGEAAAAAPIRTDSPTRDDGPRTQPNPKRHSQAKSVPATKPPQQHPAGQKRPRETAGLNDCIWHDNSAHARPRAQTTRTRQRRAAQAAQTAVGDAQERILLRDDHLASTTSARFQRTHKKRLFFGV